MAPTSTRPASPQQQAEEASGALVPATTGAIMPGGDAADVAAVIEQISIIGDLNLVPPAVRVRYYAELCHSLGLNPLTKPFEFVVLNGKLTLYARKDATEQLRALRGISVDQVDRELDPATDLYHVRVAGHDRTGRRDEAEGIVAVKGLSGEGLANAKMKAETKGKRRFTLSIAGLGMLDETEVADTPGAEVVVVDPETGEVRDYPTGLDAVRERSAARRARVAGRRRQLAVEEPEPDPAPAATPDEGATAPPAAESPEEVDKATAEVARTAIARGVVPKADPWAALDTLAADATGKAPDSLTAEEWRALGARIEAGEFDPDTDAPAAE